MEIRLAKTAGFCFGVNRAVELTYNLLDEGHKVATLGPLIHNPQAVADMERRAPFRLRSSAPCVRCWAAARYSACRSESRTTRRWCSFWLPEASSCWAI